MGRGRPAATEPARRRPACASCPRLPLARVAVAMAHLPDAAGGSAGYVSGTQFFIYK